MRLFFLSLILATFVLLSGCTLFGPGPKTITGSITGSTSNLVIAAFSDDYWFLDNLSGDDDEVGSESGGGTSFDPIATGTISGSTYSITLPDDVSTMGDLIAFVDTNSNGTFDLGAGELGYFPMKTVDGTAYVVSIGSLLENYTYNYYDGSTNHIVSIETDDDAAGFNFTVD